MKARRSTSGELARTLTVEYLIADAERLEQLGQDDAADGVDGIGADAEVALADGIDVSQPQLEHAVNVALVHGVVEGDVT